MAALAASALPCFAIVRDTRPDVPVNRRVVNVVQQMADSLGVYADSPARCGHWSLLEPRRQPGMNHRE